MTSSTWPEAYGFYIYGHACTYITYVDTDSMADTSGIRVGDMIVELDNQDVSEQSSQVLKYIANTTSSKKPPPLSVKSAALQLDLSLPPSAMLAATSRIDSMTLLGFTTRGTMPVFVDTIDESPSNAAYAGGLRAGDIIVEFDHQQLRSSDTFQDILRLAVNGSSKRSSQQLVLKYIPMAHEASERTTTAKTTKQSVAAAAAAATAVVDKSPLVSQKEESFDNKLIHTDSFQSKLNSLFPNSGSPKRQELLQSLREFSTSNDLARLASRLNSLLVTNRERELLDNVRSFLFTAQQAEFDRLINTNAGAGVTKTTKSSDIEPKAAAFGLSSPVIQSKYAHQNISKSQLELFSATVSSVKRPTPVHFATNEQRVMELTKAVDYDNDDYDVDDRVVQATPYQRVGKRVVRVERRPNGVYDFEIMGNRPIMVEAVEPGGLAERGGLRANDVILAVNGIDVEQKSHRYLTEFLQSYSSHPILEVMQKVEYDALRFTLTGTDRHMTVASDLPAQSDDSSSFKKRVKQVLNEREEALLKRALLKYNGSRDTKQFVREAKQILNTESKRDLWYFLVPVIEQIEEENARQPLYSSDESTASEATVSVNNNNNNNKTNARSRSAAPLYRQHEPSSTGVHSPFSNSERFDTFMQQSGYKLTQREQGKIASAFAAYSLNKDVDLFMERIEPVLSDKLELWFEIMSLLQEESDNEQPAPATYGKRVLRLDVVDAVDPMMTTEIAAVSPQRSRALTAAAAAQSQSFDDSFETHMTAVSPLGAGVGRNRTRPARSYYHHQQQQQHHQQLFQQHSDETVALPSTATTKTSLDRDRDDQLNYSFRSFKQQMNELNYNQEMRTRSRNYALKKTPNDATAVHFVTSMSTSTRFGSAGPVASTRHRDISLSHAHMLPMRSANVTNRAPTVTFSSATANHANQSPNEKPRQRSKSTIKAF